MIIHPLNPSIKILKILYGLFNLKGKNATNRYVHYQLIISTRKKKDYMRVATLFLRSI